MQKHVENGIWVMSGKVLAIVAGVAANAILTRAMSPNEVGVYFLMISLTSVAVLAALVGQNQTVVRFIGQLRGQGLAEKAGSVVVRAFMIVGVASLLMALAYWVFVHLLGVSLFHSELMLVGSLWMALLIVFNSLRTLGAECLRGAEEIKLATVFEGLLTNLFFAVLLFIAWKKMGAVTLNQSIVMTACAAMLSMSLALWVVWRKSAPLCMQGPVKTPELLRTGFPLLGGNLVVVVMTSFGLWVVGYLATAEDAAQYGAATRLVMLAQFPLVALNAMLPPMIARMYAENKLVEMQRIIRLSASVALILASLALLIFLLWGDGLLALLFGDYYADAKWVLVLLCVGVVANAWAGYCGPVLMMTGYQNELMHMSLFAAAVTLLATWWMGTAYGAEGVALAMSLGMALLHLLMWLAVRKHLGIWTHAGGLTNYARNYIASR